MQFVWEVHGSNNLIGIEESTCILSERTARNAIASGSCQLSKFGAEGQNNNERWDVWQYNNTEKIQIIKICGQAQNLLQNRLWSRDYTEIVNDWKQDKSNRGTSGRHLLSKVFAEVVATSRKRSFENVASLRCQKSKSFNCRRLEQLGSRMVPINPYIDAGCIDGELNKWMRACCMSDVTVRLAICHWSERGNYMVEFVARCRTTSFTDCCLLSYGSVADFPCWLPEWKTRLHPLKYYDQRVKTWAAYADWQSEA